MTVGETKRAPRLVGFTYTRITTDDGVAIEVATAGNGSPVLLLHGFPETHLAWRRVAPALVNEHRVVCMDLRGYGASDKPPGDAEKRTYAKRTMAADANLVMRELGHEQFAVAGHDRGALVALRLGLDHPEAVSQLAVLGVLPTIEMWEALIGVSGVFAFHLYFLAQPTDLPERMIGADPATFVEHFLDTWVADPTNIEPEVRSAYVTAASSPEAIHAICEDYRAGAFVDPVDEAVDRDAGRRLTMPVLAMWEDPGDVQLPFDPEEVWSRWAADLSTAVLDCGHFLAEEQPEQVVADLERLLARRTRTNMA